MIKDWGFSPQAPGFEKRKHVSTWKWTERGPKTETAHPHKIQIENVEEICYTVGGLDLHDIAKLVIMTILGTKGPCRLIVFIASIGIVLKGFGWKQRFHLVG